MASATIAAIVVNYASGSLLATNLSSVARENPELDIVVVDNFSTDPEREKVRGLARKHGWTLVEAPGNPGFGAGVNLGAARALERGASQLLLLNPDATIDGPSIRALQSAIARWDHVIASPIVRHPDGRVWFEGMTVDLAEGSMVRTPGSRSSAGRLGWVTGACMLMSAETWQALGGFDDRFFLYWEDVDLSARAVASGMHLEVVSDATAIHSVGGTQGGSRAKSSLYYYYNIRNRMLFAAVHLDAEGVTRWRATDWSAATAILLRGGRRQLLRPWRSVLPMLRGLRDGRSIARRSLLERARTESDWSVDS